jgi:threonyl-tRNA synthetase
MIRLQLPDGAEVEAQEGISIRDALADVKGIKKAVAAKVDGTVVDLSRTVTTDATVEPVMPGTPDALEVLRHTTAHVMAQAVARFFGMENVEFAIGPVIDDGFYYDFDLPRSLTDEDLPEIEKIMEQIKRENLEIVRSEATDRDDALTTIRGDRAKSKFKQELIEGFPAEESVSFYKQGEFMDLCRGPHLPSTGKLAFFKLLSVAGAYWRGDEKREQLQRIYATAFFDKKELKLFLHRREEAAKRDHRKVGQQLNLFRNLPEAPGFPLWLPNGTVVVNQLTAYMREKLEKRAYQEIRTPHIMIDDLWKQSGHYDHYKDNMYFTEIEERSFAVKPMNCPGAALAYKQGLRSYRELPLRFGEFGLCHRFERSGTLHGLTRVRSFVQDDAHLFCTPEEIQGEILALIDLTHEVYRELGFGEPKMVLSTRPEDRTGSDEMWDNAEDQLREALAKVGADYSINPGDGAFYGPKIDFLVLDVIGREQQLCTIQVDFSLPEKFDLEYVAEDGTRQRPVVIHRAILGSIERFVGLLIEQYGGAFPLWLAPEQVIVLPVSEDRHADAAGNILQELRQAGFRAHVDWSNNKLGKKIREATLKKIPYLLVVGDREADNGTAAVRRRDGTDCGALELGEMLRLLREERDTRSLTPLLGATTTDDG